MPKSGKVRSVPMVDEVAQILARQAERDKWTGDDDLVFAEDHGRWRNDDRLRPRYRKAQQAAGLRRLRFHDLRHTFGSLAITRADIVGVQAWIGHAGIQTTRCATCTTETAARPPPGSPTPSASNPPHRAQRG